VGRKWCHAHKGSHRGPRDGIQDFEYLHRITNMRILMGLQKGKEMFYVCKVRFVKWYYCST
jgi:hypothetical protein